MQIKLNGSSYNVPIGKLFFPFLVLAIVIIALFKASELKDIGQLIMQAKWYWLILALASQVFNLVLQSWVYKKVFNVLKINGLKFSKLIKATATIIFLNFTIPSVGIAGNVNFLKILKKSGIKEGKSLMTIILEVVCYYLAFLLVLLFSLSYLFFKLGNVGDSQKIAIVGFAVILLLVLFGVYFFLGKRKRAHKRILWLAKKIDLYEDGVNKEERVQELLNDFYQDFEWLKKNKRKMLSPTVVQIFKFFSDGLTILFISLAFGNLIPWGLAIVAFSFGRLFGLISCLPGGVGAFEGSMVLIFNSFGLSLELALSIMLVYRLFSYWLYFPVGLYFYKQLNNEMITKVAFVTKQSDFERKK